MRWRIPPRGRHSEQGATLVEFALVVPVFLLLLLGVMEMGRYVATYHIVYTASREAARYGSAIGDSVNGTPHYADCQEIRNAATPVDSIARFVDSDIEIIYDSGPGTSQIAACPVGGPNPNPDAIAAGDRISVTVGTNFDFVVPFIDRLIDDLRISSTDRRTIFKVQG